MYLAVSAAPLFLATSDAFAANFKFPVLEILQRRLGFEQDQFAEALAAGLTTERTRSSRLRPLNDKHFTRLNLLEYSFDLLRVVDEASPKWFA